MTKKFTVLEQLQLRVLWSAPRMTDFANNERSNADGLEVGVRQASGASFVAVINVFRDSKTMVGRSLAQSGT